MSSDRDLKVSKIVTLGDAGVGKSTLLRMFVSNEFEEFPCGIGVDFHVKTMQPSAGVVSSASQVKLQMWDTAGQERFRSLGRAYVRGAEVVLLIFDVSCQQSFDSLTEWVRYVRDPQTSWSPNLPLLFLVAAKCDKSRVVPAEDALRFAHQIDAPYFEISSKAGFGIAELFQHVADTVVQLSAYSEQVRMWNGAKFNKREGSVRLPVQGEVVPHRGLQDNDNVSCSSC